MSEPAVQPDARRSRPPVWLVEGLDIAEQRRVVLLGVIAAVVVVGAVLAWLAPGVVPPVPVVGVAVGVAAILLGLAAAVAVDTTDLTVRGPRHVGAAGGELVAVLPTQASPAAAAELAAAVAEARDPGRPLLLGLAAVGRDARPTSAWTDALAVALVRTGVSVLRIDLASGRSPGPGLIEVVRGTAALTEAVSFAPGLRLARLGAGDDHAAALGALPTLPGRLPRDLDVLLVALPTAASRPVVTAVRALDHVLLVAQRDRTSRVDVIAGLDALEAAGTEAQVALLDDRTCQRLGLRTSGAAAEAARPTGPATVGEELGVGVRDDEGEDPASEEVARDVDGPGRDFGPDPVGGHPAADRVIGPGPVIDPEPAVGPEPDEALEQELGEVEAAVAPTAPSVEEPDAREPPGQSVPDAAVGGLRAASEPRAVDVMLGAMEAAAEAAAERTEPQPSDEAASDVPPQGPWDHAATPSSPPAPGRDVSSPRAPEPPDAASPSGPSPVPAERPASSDDEDTDQMRAMSRPPPVRPAESERDDLLRTTAQLAHLMDDLDVRGDDAPRH